MTAAALIESLKPGELVIRCADGSLLRTMTSDVAVERFTADRGRVRQVLYNLLSNAIKFTPDGGSITVDARALSDMVELSVTDTGPGISPDDQAVIFDEFRQVGEMSGRQQGTGLGLALARRLAEAHGGMIELHSELGTGSRFTETDPYRFPLRFAYLKRSFELEGHFQWNRYLIVDRIDEELDVEAAERQIGLLVTYVRNAKNLIRLKPDDLAMF